MRSGCVLCAINGRRHASCTRITAALEDDSPGLFLVALRNVAEAHGGTGAIADATHLNRQTMYRWERDTPNLRLPQRRQQTRRTISTAGRGGGVPDHPTFPPTGRGW